MTDAAAVLAEVALRSLRADPALVTLLGGPSIYDRAPRDAPLPLIAMETLSTTDWSTATEIGAEHRLVFDIRTRGGGRRPAAEVADALRRSLTVRPLAGLPGHRLISMIHRETAITVEPGEIWRARVTFRAVTEQAD